MNSLIRSTYHAETRALLSRLGGPTAALGADGITARSPLTGEMLATATNTINFGTALPLAQGVSFDVEG